MLGSSVVSDVLPFGAIGGEGGQEVRKAPMCLC